MFEGGVGGVGEGLGVAWVVAIGIACVGGPEICSECITQSGTGMHGPAEARLLNWGKVKL